MLSDADMHRRMVKGWKMGKPETVCGNGSTMVNTANIRRWLPQVCMKHGLIHINDAGAGDLAWIRKINWLVAYRAFDLIPRLPNIEALDITTQVMPPCDAILCRMVLNHLDEPRILMALEQFRKSGRFLIATQFNRENLSNSSPQFARFDLRYEPYSLGEPLEAVQDSAENICTLALWRL